MRILRRDVLLAAGLAVFLLAAVWAAFLVTSRAVNQLLRQDAEAEGEAWARYLAANVKDLPQLVAGETPSVESRHFFEQAQKVGDVFLYKIYDARGALRLSSDKLEEVGKISESIPVHNPEAAEVVLEGETEIEAKEGEPPNRPDFYSEAYVPVVVGGRIIGIVEAYVDQSAKRATFHARIASVAVALAAIIAVAFGLPALGFYWRTRQKRQADSRAEFLAHHDALTHILNRARFMTNLDEAIGLGCPIVVHTIDINRFKDINDTLGPAIGDAILKQMALRLQTLSNKQDLLARLGGDEFALAEIVRGAGQVTKTARRIVAALGETYHLNDRDIEASVNVGSAVAPAHGDDAATLLRNAEIALNHSKSEATPGSRSLFRPEMDAELQAQREIETMVRSALANESFELAFQPIHRTADRRIAGFEALLRLPKNGGGHVSPAIFVPVAERLGLISEIGNLVIRRACAMAAAWPSQLTVAVNLSPAEFADGQIAERVQSALNASGLAARRLEIEITEGLLLSDSESVMRQLADLKALGVRIAMDDFGTGYSSLGYLWRFPFDKLKIDQSFTRALGEDEHVASVIQAIVALGRSLDMIITAEGVETEMQAEFLRRIGCHQLQGFHLGRPMPVDRLPGEILKDFRSAIPKTEPEVTAPLVRSREG